MKFPSSLIASSLLWLALLPTFSIGAENDRLPSTFQSMDVFQLEYAADPRIAPDGKRVLYLRNSMEIIQVFF